MVRLLSDRSYPELVFGAFTIVVIVALIVAASTSGAAFGAFTFSWEGTSDLRDEAESSDAELIIATDTERYEEVDPDGTVAFVLAPDERYDGEDRERLREFVEDGGTLVVADAFGPHGNPLLEDMGASARLNGDPLRDERNYYRSPALPVATNIGEHPYVARSEGITLNHGTIVEPGESTVIARSSEYGYLDHNRNRELDDEETLASYPVITTEEVGNGEVVVVSDPSVFINVMLDRPGNRAFANGLFALHDRILFDTSHSADVPPAAAAMLSLRESAALQALLGGGIVLSIAATHRRSALTPLWARIQRRTGSAGRAGLSEAEMRRRLTERHPDWDESRRDRVITTITSRKKDVRDD